MRRAARRSLITAVNSAPLGIFDSGVGGLTVVRAVQELLPGEDVIYLGDTARVPYGSKSPETIRQFAAEDAGYLVEKGVKAVVVACNTAADSPASTTKPITIATRPNRRSASTISGRRM